MRSLGCTYVGLTSTMAVTAFGKGRGGRSGRHVVLLSVVVGSRVLAICESA
jgi:hypothetical protein